jgi:hypothetical protein
VVQISANAFALTAYDGERRDEEQRAVKEATDLSSLS